ncbi:uncharacterized protein LOC107811530 isoform X1 [Nicotiana tabacum]|uniref:Biogenesis of lysosome-related organelles complex 1 subunit 7 n=1 Tax=Nicotiana tabacum TaxID=4097 RepID=A0A1S4BT51_TOBAC|nr:PREDICTED: uncharacterized protein LOC107811530 isoform X1 [Nicotiana tabacum]XP_016491972.1 PREDICTED: uncharacterized protein LOC107811530 isoform X1 [Nicotiana tabacum]XP_016491973.1 PREDICTED: uncharacterized protein LOC107811530 isoform X1 [Nicotiana tabacum]
MSNEVPEKQPCDTAEHDPTSVAVDGDDDNSDASNSALAKGLSTIISSIIREFDDSAAATSRSQDQLSSTLDRLTGELDKLLEDAPLPFIMQHAARISGVRKRITSLNSLLKSIQRRLDNIDHTLSAGLIHGNASSSLSLSIYIYGSRGNILWWTKCFKRSQQGMVGETMRTITVFIDEFMIKILEKIQIAFSVPVKSPFDCKHL